MLLLVPCNLHKDLAQHTVYKWVRIILVEAASILPGLSTYPSNKHVLCSSQ